MVIFPFGDMCIATKPVGERVLRFKPERSVVVSDGSIWVTLPTIRGSPAAEGQRVLGIELQRGIEIPDRFVVLPFVTKAIAPDAVGIGVVGIQAYGFAQVGNRLVQQVLFTIGYRPVVIGFCTLWPEPNELTHIGRCLFPLIPVAVQDAPQHVRGRVVRVQL